MRSLMSLVDLAETMRIDQRIRTLPGDQRDQFRQFAINFRDAARWVDQFDIFHPRKPWQVIEPEGWHELSASAESNLGDVLAAGFIERSAHLRGRPTPRTDHPNRVLAANPGRVLEELLLALSLTFANAANALQTNTPRGGQKRQKVVRAMLFNLADTFFELFGREPGGGDGPFREFAGDVFRLVGPDANQIDSTIKEVLKARKGFNST